MCRHLAYLGPPATLRSVLIDPPHGLYRQAWAPRRQRYGTVNADGFGVGWYAPDDPDPARYRRPVPIWGDESFADVARVTRAGAMLAAVRCATAGTDPGPAAVAPYASGPWLFSHNGVLDGWPQAAAGLAATLPAGSLLGLEARVDSALLWALVRHRLELGLGACRGPRGHRRGAACGRPDRAFQLPAYRRADDRGYRGRRHLVLPPVPGPAAPAVVVASEPGDDEPGWTEVPDGSVVSATPPQVSVAELADSCCADPEHRRRKDRDPMTSLDRRLPPGFLEEALRADALSGLTSAPKSLPPKWFYDAQGSALFDKITELPEYYPTRAEREILTATAAGIAAQTRARTLIELGSGSSDKTRLLLDALRAAGTLRCYVPVDVSEPALAAAGNALSAEYPGLDVRAVVSDFEERLGFPADGDAPAPRLVAFLGSTIGNLVPAQRAAFLARVRARLRPGDFFLLGTDLVKDPATLVAAYDDASGVTAEFNKNVLAVLNAELGADFDLDEFEHVAVWDADAEWIEMRLRSLTAQTVRLPAIGLTVDFADGEEMRTEVSAKFRREGVSGELAAAGFAMRSWWTDAAAQFGLSLSVPA